MSDVSKRVEELVEYAKVCLGGYYQPEYIATFNPAFVLKLLEAWREMREALDFYKRDKNKNFREWTNHVEYDWGQRALSALENADKVFE